jgi:hypothetical protein
LAVRADGTAAVARPDHPAILVAPIAALHTDRAGHPTPLSGVVPGHHRCGPGRSRRAGRHSVGRGRGASIVERNRRQEEVGGVGRRASTRNARVVPERRRGLLDATQVVVPAGPAFMSGRVSPRGRPRSSYARNPRISPVIAFVYPRGAEFTIGLATIRKPRSRPVGFACDDRVRPNPGERGVVQRCLVASRLSPCGLFAAASQAIPWRA